MLMHRSSRFRRIRSFRIETPARVHVVNDDMAIPRRTTENRPIKVLTPVPACADPGSLLGHLAMHMLRLTLRESAVILGARLDSEPFLGWTLVRACEAKQVLQM